MSSTKGLLQRFLDPPSSTAIDDAVQRLIEIGAISKLRLELTPLGHHLSFVPIELRLAKMYVVACCCSVTRNTSRALAS